MMRSQGGTDVAKNKDTLLWGIGILFVMVSIWGIIIFAQDAIFGKDTKYLKENIKLPTIPNTSGYNSAGTNPNSAGNGNKNKPSPAIGGKLPDKPVGNVTRNVVDPGSGSNGGGPGGTASDSCSFSAVKAGSDARGERLTFCSADSRCLEVDHSCKGDITCTDENGESKTYHYCTWNNSQGLGTYEEEMAKKRAAEEAFTP